MKTSKKVISVILSALMIFSSFSMSMTVFAENIDLFENEYVAPSYTKEELSDISNQHGYDLSQEEIEKIAGGEMTLSDALEDKEEKVTLIVQLSDEGILAKDEAALTDDGLSSEALDKIEEIEEQQEKVEKRIEKNVFDSEDIDVLYSYSLLTNSFAIEARQSQIDEIAGIKGVESVYTAPEYTVVPTDEISKSYAENYFTGSDNTTAYTGEGTVTAIIDTGIDITHNAFKTTPKNPRLSDEDIVNKYELTHAYKDYYKGLAAEYYVSEKIPFAFNYADKSFDITHKNDDQTDHGTHVAGIIGGYDVNPEGKIVFEGVAPDTQLVIMKVFGSTRAGNFADVLAAIEDAIILGVDAINLSLGSPAGFTYGGAYPDINKYYEEIMNSGVVLSCAAGNDYSAGYGSLYGNNLSLASNPDNGIVSSPASYGCNFAVASAESNSYYAKCVKISGKDVAYTCNSTATAGDDSRNIEKYNGETKLFAPLSDDEGSLLTGSVKDFESYAEACAIKGKFVLVKRGQTFTKTVELAEKNGAIGLIVCDNTEGKLVNMSENESVSIPAIFISKANGEYIFANYQNNNQIEITLQSNFTENSGKGNMSAFSSWGVTSDLKLKPEITGYGGSVYSSTDNNSYGLKSGTSMATPYITGVCALIAQQYNKLHEGDEVALKKAKRNYATAVMMSTANPLVEKSESTTYSPRKQGAGLVNIDNALSTKAYIKVEDSETPKIDLGDDKEKTGVYDLSFEVVNTGDIPLTFEIGAGVQTEKVQIENVSYLTQKLDLEKAEEYYTKRTALGDDFSNVEYEQVNVIDELENVKFMSGLPYDLTEKSTVTTDKTENTVTVPANETVSVRVTVTLGEEAKAYMDENFENGIYVEGFVTLTSKTDGQCDLVAPYMGFYGDWTQAPIIDEGTWEEELSGENVHPQMNSSKGNSVFSYSNFITLTPLGTNFSFDTQFFFFLNSKKNGEKYEYKPSERNLISSENSSSGYNDNAAAAETSLLRSAKEIKYTVRDKITGEVYAESIISYAAKTSYNRNTKAMRNAGTSLNNTFVWNGTDKNGEQLPAGTQAVYTVTAYVDYGEKEAQNNKNYTYSFDVIIDGSSPEVKSVELYRDEDTGDTMMKSVLYDDNFPSAIKYVIHGYNSNAISLSAYPEINMIPGTKGENVEVITNLSEEARKSGLTTMRYVSIEVEDFVGNGTGNLGKVNDEFCFPLYDNVTVQYDSAVIPIGSSMILTPNATYGYGIKKTQVFDPANGDCDRFDIQEDFVYSSSNEDVATVTPGGIVMAKGEGYTTITVEGEFSHIKTTFRLRVIKYALQKLIDNTVEGSTLYYEDENATETIKIDKDITIDLNGKTITGVDGSPAFTVTKGNVTIKNGTLKSVYSKDSENALLLDAINENVGTVCVLGGSLTLENVNVTGTTAEIDGKTTLLGSAVKISNGSKLTVENSNLKGLYAINNNPKDAAKSGEITLASGNLEGVIASVSDVSCVVSGKNSALADVTNATLDEPLSYYGSVEGTAYTHNIPEDMIFIPASQIAQGTVTAGSALSYDEENKCAVYDLCKNSQNRYDTQYITISGLNINADEYKYFSIIEEGSAKTSNYVLCRVNSSYGSTKPSISKPYYDPQTKKSDKATYTMNIGRWTDWKGNVSSITVWPAFSTATSSKTANTIKIYGIAFTKDGNCSSYLSIADYLSSTTNMKAVKEQTFNSKLTLNAGDLFVNCTFEDVCDSTYKWIPNTISLYKRISATQGQFIESKPVTPDANGEINTVFSGVTQGEEYYVELNSDLYLNAETTDDIYSIKQDEVEALFTKLPELIDEATCVSKIEECMRELVSMTISGARAKFVARDEEHIDSPAVKSKGFPVYPNADQYPNMVWRSIANVGNATWSDYYDLLLLPEKLIGTSSKVGMFCIIAKTLGDTQMKELMAGLANEVPKSVYDSLEQNWREGKYGETGSITRYNSALNLIKEELAKGNTSREKLTYALEALSDSVADIYSSVVAIYGTAFDKTADSNGTLKTTDNFRGFLAYSSNVISNIFLRKYTDSDTTGIFDRDNKIQNCVDSFLSLVEPNYSFAESFKYAIQNQLILSALSNYDENTSSLLSVFFDSNEIENGLLQAKLQRDVVSNASYDAYIHYELDGGTNSENNPAGYQRAFPVTFDEPFKTGYRFEGFYTSAGFEENTKITATMGETAGDITLYAKWSILSYNISYVANEQPFGQQNCQYASDISPIADIPEKAGYVFDYWYESNEAVPFDFKTMPGRDITLTARFRNITLADFDYVDGVYKWTKADNSPLSITVEKSCTIDFCGKTVTSVDSKPIVTVSKGVEVTVKNGTLVGESIENNGSESYTVYVRDRSKLTVENTVIYGSSSKQNDKDYYLGSAIKAEYGTVNIKSSILTGMYAVNNKPGDNQSAKVFVNIEDSILIGVASIFANNKNIEITKGERLDISASLAGVLPETYETRIGVYGEQIEAGDNTQSYNGSTNTVTVTSENTELLTFPDGTAIFFKPSKLIYGESEISFNNNHADITCVTEGVCDYDVVYDSVADMSQELSDVVSSLEAMVVTATKSEIATFDASLESYNDMITYWDNYKTAIKQKFYSTEKNSAVKSFLTTIRACLEAIGGSDYTGSAAAGKGILPELKETIEEYKLLTETEDKLQWLLENKERVVELSDLLDKNFDTVYADCVMLNGLSQFYYGDDYSEKLSYVEKITEKSGKLRGYADTIPLVSKAEYEASPEVAAENILSSQKQYTNGTSVDITAFDTASLGCSITIKKVVYSILDMSTELTDDTVFYYASTDSMPQYTPEKRAGRTFTAFGDGVTDDETFTTSFSGKMECNTYTVTWDIDGEKETEQFTYPQVPEYTSTTPVRSCTEDKYYTFSGFTPLQEAITSDITYTAVFTENDKSVPEYALPEGLTAVYGDTLENVELPQGFAWTNNTISAGEAGVNVFKAIYTPEDTEHELVVGEIEVSVTVSKANPKYTVPKGLTAYYGRILSDVKLPSGFEWKTPSLSVGNAGINSFNAKYVPADTKNYNIVDNIKVEVKVNKATPNIQRSIQLSGEYGKPLSSIKLPSTEEGYYTWLVVNPDEVILASGRSEYVLAFVPYDSNNYISASGTRAIITTPECPHAVWSDYTSNGDSTLFKNGTKTRACFACGKTETVEEENSSVIKAFFAKIKSFFESLFKLPF